MKIEKKVKRFSCCCVILVLSMSGCVHVAHRSAAGKNINEVIEDSVVSLRQSQGSVSLVEMASIISDCLPEYHLSQLSQCELNKLIGKLASERKHKELWWVTLYAQITANQCNVDGSKSGVSE